MPADSKEGPLRTFPSEILYKGLGYAQFRLRLINVMKRNIMDAAPQTSVLKNLSAFTSTYNQLTSRKENNKSVHKKDSRELPFLAARTATFVHHNCVLSLMNLMKK